MTQEQRERIAKLGGDLVREILKHNGVNAHYLVIIHKDGETSIASADSPPVMREVISAIADALKAGKGSPAQPPELRN